MVTFEQLASARLWTTDTGAVEGAVHSGQFTRNATRAPHGEHAIV
jgi:hypothetical protein